MTTYKGKARAKFYYEGSDSITARLSASPNGMNNEEAVDYRQEFFILVILSKSSCGKLNSLGLSSFNCNETLIKIFDSF